MRRGHTNGPRALALAALALLVLARLEPIREHSPGRPSSSSLASAAYLDSVGQLTNVMNEFVNSLLEKVSFLAEIIIESSLEEECGSPFLVGVATSTPQEDAAKSQTESGGGSGSGTETTTAKTTPARSIISAEACRRYERRHNLSASAGLARAAGPPLNPHKLRRENFDENEFKNVDLFLDAYLAEGDSSSAPGADAQGPPVPRAHAGCKLFTFDLSPEDLPADDMGHCCNQFHACYSSCGATKLECDVQFRACLTGICKSNFNYKNETLVRAFEARLAGRRHFGKRHATDNEELADEDQDEDLGFEPAASEDEPERAANSLEDEADEEEPQEESTGLLGRVLGKRQAGDEQAEAAEGEQVAAGGGRDNDGGGGGESSPDELDARAIKRMRDKYKACKLASKLLIIGNLAFGCQNYRRAQWQACCLQ